MKRSRSAGFTLVEVLISITLLALISGICYAAFHLGIRAVAKGEAAVVTAQRLRAATDVLIHQVKSAVTSPALIDGDNYPYFYGTPTSMSFITEAAQFGGGGRARVKYTFVTDPPQLVLEESPYFDAETLGGVKPELAEARTAVILDGFRNGSFQFYDGCEASDECPGKWCGSWNPVETDTIPTAVRITVEGLFGMDEDVWGQEIPMMVPASTYADAACELPESAEPEDCESALTTSTPQTGQGSGSGKGSAAGGDDDGDDGDDGDDD